MYQLGCDERIKARNIGKRSNVKKEEESQQKIKNIFDSSSKITSRNLKPVRKTSSFFHR